MNLLRPWVLARLLSGAASVALVLIGVVVAARVLRYWRVGVTSEGQLALERRAELVAAIVQVALVIAVANLALTVLVADRLTHSIRGAMCAWGVFDASGWGFLALATTGVAAAACAFWMVLHRLDLRLRKPVLTKRKFIALFVILPIVALDLFATSRWVLDLDMEATAACCSIGLDSRLAEGGAASRGPRILGAWLALGAAVAAGLFAFAAWRKPTPVTGWITAILSGVAAFLAMPAILGTVAPHAYESPYHLCPFCLLHADVAGLGWPLFSALFGAGIFGTAIGLVEAHRRRSNEPAQVSDLVRRLGGWAAVCWALTVVLGVAPVVRYAWITGGTSLFGGT